MSYFFFFVIFIFYSDFCAAEQNLLFLLKHAPTQIIQSIKKEELKKAEKNALFSGHSSRLARKIFTRGLKKALLPSLGGFPTFYAGYSDYSDLDGTVIYPLRHTSHKIYLVITPSFKLAPLTKNIIHSMQISDQEEDNLSETQEVDLSQEQGEKAIELTENNHTEIYLCERKKLDDGTLFWNISQSKLPENRIISKLSLIILTKPKNLFVPCGSFFIDPSQKYHYALPPIYVIGNIDQNRTLINAAELLPFFEPIDKSIITTPGIVRQSLINNH